MGFGRGRILWPGPRLVNQRLEPMSVPRAERVGAGNPVTSRDLHVLVEEAAEPVSSEHVDRWPGGSRGVVHGRALMQ